MLLLQDLKKNICLTLLLVIALKISFHSLNKETCTHLISVVIKNWRCATALVKIEKKQFFAFWRLVTSRHAVNTTLRYKAQLEC